MENEQTIMLLLKAKNNEMTQKFTLIDILKLLRFISLYSKIHDLKQKLVPYDLIILNEDLKVYDMIIMKILESTDRNYIVKELSDISIEIESMLNDTNNYYSSMFSKKDIKEKLSKYYTDEEIEKMYMISSSKDLEKELKQPKSKCKIIEFRKYK